MVAFLAGMTLPRYSYYLYCVPIASRVEAYLNDQIKFAKCLPNEMLKYLKVRLYSLDRAGIKEIDGSLIFPDIYHLIITKKTN